jgi:hypothetical protein
LFYNEVLDRADDMRWGVAETKFILREADG